jgi:DNA-binding NarL/FixJ family response regulator
VIQVLLVDDQPLIRSGFRALLDLEDDIVVVAEAADGAEGLELAVRYLPDVALIDIQMPVLDGMEAPRRIAADPALAGVHVVILTNYGLDEYVLDALRAGAVGFLVEEVLRRTSCTPYASPRGATSCSPLRSPAHSSTATSPSRRPPTPAPAAKN